MIVPEENKKRKRDRKAMIMLFDQKYATEAYVNSEVRKAKQIGIEIGEQRGEQRGRAKERISLLASLVKSGLLGKETAAQQAGLTVDEFERKSREL